MANKMVKCSKCGVEYSARGIRLHEARCTGEIKDKPRTEKTEGECPSCKSSNIELIHRAKGSGEFDPKEVDNFIKLGCTHYCLDCLEVF